MRPLQVANLISSKGFTTKLLGEPTYHYHVNNNIRIYTFFTTLLVNVILPEQV